MCEEVCVCYEYVCTCAHVNSVHAEARRQLCEVTSLFSLYVCFEDQTQLIRFA